MLLHEYVFMKKTAGEHLTEMETEGFFSAGRHNAHYRVLWDH